MNTIGMTMKHKNLTLCILFALTILPFLHISTQAQCPGEAFEHLDINNVKARYHNSVDQFWDLVGSPAYEVPQGSGKHSAFATGVWIGGLDPSSNLHVAAQTYRQTGNDFYAGPHRSTGNYDCGIGFVAGGPAFDNGILTLSNGKVLVLYSNGFTVYDPVAQTQQNKILPVNRLRYRAVELPDGRVFLYGDDSYPTVTASMIMDTISYNPATTLSLNHFHQNSSATVLANGKVLIAGLDGCEIYDPVANTSQSVGTMTQGRAHHAAILLNNGDVLLAGGSATFFSQTPLSTTEVFDTGNNTFAAGPALTVPRRRCRLTELAGGDVLITGGSQQNPQFGIYDPSQNTISAGPTPEFVVDLHSAVKLPNGEIFITSDEIGLGGQRMMRLDPVANTFEYAMVLGGEHLGASIGGGKVVVERGDNHEFQHVDAMTLELEEQRWQKIWKVTRAEIDQFLLDFQNNSVNFANYPDIETWPARGNTNKGEDNHLAPFVDVNNDARYEPLADGDYPCVEGDQALWWAANDDGPHDESGGVPMELQVETMAYAYDCSSTNCPDSSLDNTTFFHYEITNKSGQRYTDVYFGVWFDADVGNFADDFVGCDTLLNLAFAYNGDADDETASGYGMNPPAIGTVILRSPEDRGMTNFMVYNNDFTVTGNPEQPIHYYNYMRSLWKDATPVINNGSTGYGGSGPITTYMYPGDGGFCGGPTSGWSEVSAQNQPFDRRFLQGVGPFTINIGEKAVLDIAVVWAQGSDNLNSVCELKDVALATQSFFDSLSHGCFNIILAQDDPIPGSDALDLYPNPSTGAFTLSLPEGLQDDAAVTIWDGMGKMVMRDRWTAGFNQHVMDASQLSAGVYMVTVHNEYMKLGKKILIQR